MHDLPTGWGALCGVVFLLGMRHGLDADHLATIDGMTRIGVGAGRRFARWCGALFSLGHGTVVITIAGTVGFFGDRWVLPTWVDAAGGWVSVAFLVVLGLVNLRAALRSPPGSVVGLAGFKATLFGSPRTARGPLAVAAVGAMFALSFDTLSQAAFFAVAGIRYSGVASALLLGALFTLGMLLVDGLNGWWIAHLISRADRLTAFASRIMAFVVAGVSLGVGALGAAKLLWPAAGEWSAGAGWLLGAGVVAVVGLGFSMAYRWQRGRRPTGAPRPTVPADALRGGVG